MRAPSIRIVELVAEALRPDGAWVGLGVDIEGRWILLARRGRALWIREGKAEAMIDRFQDWGNLVGFRDRAAPAARLILHDLPRVLSRLASQPDEMRRPT